MKHMLNIPFDTRYCILRMGRWDMFVPESVILTVHDYYVEERVRMARSGFHGWTLHAWRCRGLRLARELGQALVHAGTSLQKLAQQS